MKNKSEKTRKIIQKDYERMWGEDGPYSQANIKEQVRILDDSISRVFFVIEAEINPFTFEYVKKNQKHFISDEAVLQLLEHAEYRGEFGYVVSAGEVEIKEEGARKFAEKQLDMLTQTIIRMHEFVMHEFNLKKEKKFGVMKDNGPLVWNEMTGRAEVDSVIWSNETFIGGSAGVMNNKMRYFIIFAHARGLNFKGTLVKSFTKSLCKTSADFKVDVENCESFMEYVLITALIPFDCAPASFIEETLDACNKGRQLIFQKDYFITNVKRPTQDQIVSFLKQLPLDKDIRMK